jgi:hypothetical protein
MGSCASQDHIGYHRKNMNTEPPKLKKLPNKNVSSYGSNSVNSLNIPAYDYPQQQSPQPANCHNNHSSHHSNHQSNHQADSQSNHQADNHQSYDHGSSFADSGHSH